MSDELELEGRVRSGGQEADLVDTTKDMEIELHLPQEVDVEQDIDLVRTSENPRGPSPGGAASI